MNSNGAPQEKISVSSDPALPKRRTGPLLVSYAQNSEDVLLERVFSTVDHGFYVDIGAFDPTFGSVTKIFYDRGWNGINIEPSSAFEKLKTSRPRDVNLNVAILDRSGTVDFVENDDDPGTSHVGMPAGDLPATSRVRTVPCERLDSVLAEHTSGGLINFLKIDAEGSEDRIVKSTDWTKIRPQVLLIEAVEPWTNTIISANWESTLVASGYQRAYFDGINLFFVRREDADLIRHFDRPVNVLDWFEKYDPVKNAAIVTARELTKRAEELNEFRRQALRPIKQLASRFGDRLIRDASGAAAGRSMSAGPFTLKRDEAVLTLEAIVDLFDAFVKDIEKRLAERRKLALASSPDQMDIPRNLPDVLDVIRLRREIDDAVQAAILYDRIATLKDPGSGSRALRIGLLVARRIRAITRLISPKHRAAKVVDAPGHDNAFAHAVFEKVSGGLQAAFRVLFWPVVSRSRAFVLAPLDPTIEHVLAIKHDLDAIKQALERMNQLSPDAIRNLDALLRTPKDTEALLLTPELIKSIEALLLTAIVCPPRQQ